MGGGAGRDSREGDQYGGELTVQGHERRPAELGGGGGGTEPEAGGALDGAGARGGDVRRGQGGPWRSTTPQGACAAAAEGRKEADTVGAVGGGGAGAARRAPPVGRGGEVRCGSGGQRAGEDDDARASGGKMTTIRESVGLDGDVDEQTQGAACGAMEGGAEADDVARAGSGAQVRRGEQQGGAGRDGGTARRSDKQTKSTPGLGVTRERA